MICWSLPELNFDPGTACRILSAKFLAVLVPAAILLTEFAVSAQVEDKTYSLLPDQRLELQFEVKGNYHAVADNFRSIYVGEESSLAVVNLDGDLWNVSADQIFVRRTDINFVNPSREIFAWNNHAYSVNGQSGLYTLDVSQADQPKLLGHCDTPGDAQDIVVIESIAYVADGEPGLAVIDLSDLSTPKLIGHFKTDGGATGVGAISYTGICVSTRKSLFELVDVSDHTKPILISKSPFPGDGDRILGGWPRIYVAEKNVGVRIFALSEDLRPKLMGHYDTTDAITDMTARDSMLYVTDAAFGLRIFDCCFYQMDLFAEYRSPGIAQGLELFLRGVLLTDSVRGLISLQLPSNVHFPPRPID